MMIMTKTIIKIIIRISKESSVGKSSLGSGIGISEFTHSLEITKFQIIF